MVCETSHEVHSLHKKHREYYFQVKSLIKNFFFRLKFFLVLKQPKNPTQPILARWSKSIGKLGRGWCGRDNLGCKMLICSWDCKTICLWLLFGCKYVYHEEDAQLYSTWGKAGWMPRRLGGISSLPPEAETWSCHSCNISFKAASISCSSVLCDP